MKLFEVNPQVPPQPQQAQQSQTPQQPVGGTPLSPQSVASLQSALMKVSPIEIAQLVKELEDIKRGGNDWRRKISTLGMKPDLWQGNNNP